MLGKEIKQDTDFYVLNLSTYRSILYTAQISEKLMLPKLCIGVLVLYSMNHMIYMIFTSHLYVIAGMHTDVDADRHGAIANLID